MKRQDIFRNLKFIGITVGSGLILIFVLFAFDSNPFSDSDFEIPIQSNKEDLEKRVLQFKNDDLPFNEFSIVLTSITSSTQQGMLQKSTQNYLINDLLTGYEKRVYAKCEVILKNGGSVSSYKEHLRYLVELKTVTGSKSEIQYYTNQINKLSFYENNLPYQVEIYIENTYNYFDPSNCEIDFFDINQNAKFINLLKNKPNLDSKYINQDLENRLSELIKKLNKLEKDYNTFKIVKC
jgi:hypothetical protein